MGRPSENSGRWPGKSGATPDALGPKGFGASSGDEASGAGVWDGFLLEARVSGLKRDHAGVMAQTGMGTAEIVKGIVQETEPDAVIVVDALAARVPGDWESRCSYPIQGISRDRGRESPERADGGTLGIPVFAIRIPMVVEAAAIVYDTVGAMTEVLRRR